MATIGIVKTEEPTSNHVASVISVLDEPSAYKIDWEGVKDTPDKTYTVESIHPNNRPQLHLEGNRIIDANPKGQPRVLYDNPSDGYLREQRLVDFELYAKEYHWRHQVQYISDRLQRRLGLPDPRDHLDW